MLLNNKTINFDIPDIDDINKILSLLEDRITKIESVPAVNLEPIFNNIKLLNDRIDDKSVSFDEFKLLESKYNELYKLAGDYDYLNIVKDTPSGLIAQGGDVAGALQWAVNNVHIHKKTIYIPAGQWLLSETITAPMRSGITLIGAGFNNGTTDNRFNGAGTILKWSGPANSPMMVFQGTHHIIGDFALVGDSGRSNTGILIKKINSGLGTGTIRFKPICGINLNTVIQCSSGLMESNCDNLHFEWLQVDKCNRAYLGLNQQGMDIVFERLNINWTPIALDMSGGGSLWVQYSTTAGNCTFLKINAGDGVGKNNGWFRLSNTKVDSQSGNNFTLVDSNESYPIRILADGGIYSNDKLDGVFARLTGGNHLTVTDWTSTFKSIIGVKDNTYGRPSVIIRDSRVWGNSSNIFSGDIKGKIYDCINHPWNSDSVWINKENA